MDIWPWEPGIDHQSHDGERWLLYSDPQTPSSSEWQRKWCRTCMRAVGQWWGVLLVWQGTRARQDPCAWMRWIQVDKVEEDRRDQKWALSWASHWTLLRRWVTSIMDSPSNLVWVELNFNLWVVRWKIEVVWTHSEERLNISVVHMWFKADEWILLAI